MRVPDSDIPERELVLVFDYVGQGRSLVAPTIDGNIRIETGLCISMRGAREHQGGPTSIGSVNDEHLRIAVEH